MGKKLAILGHSTCGNEVIELLEMLGGVNGKIDKKTGEPYNVYNGRYFVSEICNVREVAYYIDFESQIRCIDIKDITTDFICYSFEMFLEKFPFKVGDFVRIPEYESEVRILKMKWCPVSEHIEYLICPNDEDEWFTADELLEDNDNPLKDNDNPTNVEDTQSKRDIDKAEFMIKHMILPNKMDDKLEYEIIDGYEFDKVENGKIILKPIKPKYPTTYAECKEMLDENVYYGFSVFMTLQKLLICRNAYWKIAGEEMGLGKPWKPDYTKDEKKYCIGYDANKLTTYCISHSNKILAFPTEEIRDVFYENFKDLIEECKALL